MLVFFIVLFSIFSKENDSCFYLFRGIICRAITRCREETQEVLLVSKNMKSLNKITAEENSSGKTAIFLNTNTSNNLKICFPPILNICINVSKKFKFPMATLESYNFLLNHNGFVS